MPIVRWDEVPEPETIGFGLRPQPTDKEWPKYHAKVANCVATFPNGIERWEITWQIVAGASAGYTLRDWIYWGGSSDEQTLRSLSRCKLYASRLGWDVKTPREEPIEIKPEEFVGRHAILTLQLSDKTDREGKPFVNIAWNGIESVPNQPPPISEDEDIPF